MFVCHLFSMLNHVQIILFEEYLHNLILFQFDINLLTYKIDMAGEFEPQTNPRCINFNCATVASIQIYVFMFHVFDEFSILSSKFDYLNFMFPSLCKYFYNVIPFYIQTLHI